MNFTSVRLCLIAPGPGVREGPSLGSAREPADLIIAESIAYRDAVPRQTENLDVKHFLQGRRGGEMVLGPRRHDQPIEDPIASRITNETAEWMADVVVYVASEHERRTIAKRCRADQRIVVIADPP